MGRLRESPEQGCSGYVEKGNGETQARRLCHFWRARTVRLRLRVLACTFGEPPPPLRSITMKTFLYPLCALALTLSQLSHGAPELPAVAPQANSKQLIIGKYLNPGGEFYLCMDTGEWAKKLELMLAKLEAAAETNMPEDAQEGVALAFHFANAFLRHSGVKDFGGFGASSVKLAEGLHHNRLFVQYPTGGPKGFLWEAFTAKNHSLAFAQCLPRKTAFARWGVLRPQPVWEWVKATIKTSGNAELVSKFEEAMAELERDGIELERYLASVTGGVGMVATLDPARMVKLPLDRNNVIELPAFDGALVVEVKDDTLFELIGKELAKKGEKYDEVNTKGIRALVFPEKKIDDSELAFRMTIARFDGYLVLASSPRLVGILAAKKGRLLATPHLKQCQKAMPKEGFGFMYLSPVATRTGYDAVLKAIAAEEPEAAKAVAAAYSPLRGMFNWSVTLHTPDGVAIVANQSSGITQFLITHGPSIHLPILAGMLLPALGQPREKARRISDMNNLKQIGTGLTIYSNEYAEKFPDDLGVLMAKEYIRTGTIYVCPASNTVPPKTPEELRAGQCDYLYFGKGLTMDDLDTEDPIACTKPGLFSDGYINVLYGDAHVEGHPQMPENVRKLIEATGQK